MSLRPLGDVRDDLAGWASGRQARVPTGFPFFDTRTHGGIATGELCVAFARTGVGKTWFALNVVANNPEVPTVFFSLEMHARYILSRLAAISTGVTTMAIEHNLAAHGRDEALDWTVGQYGRLMIDDETGTAFDDMMIQCERYADEHGTRPKLVVVDFLGLVTSFSMDNVVKELMKEAKQFARRMNVAVLMLHQANRGGHRTTNQGHEPLRLTDMEYGGEQLADYAIGMYRPALDPTLPPVDRPDMDNQFFLQLLKSRAGGDLLELGEQHHFDRRTGRLTPLTKPQPRLEVIR